MKIDSNPVLPVKPFVEITPVVDTGPVSVDDPRVLCLPEVLRGSGILDPRTWTGAAKGELQAHMQELGLPTNTPNPIAAVLEAELNKGIALDSRVSAADMKRASARALEAMGMVADPQHDLFGFNRLIDAKFFFDEKSVRALVAGVLSRPGRITQLLGAIANGPGNGATAWARPTTPSELVASLIRHAVLGKGASLQLNLSHELAQWMEDTLARGGIEVSEAMGGAGGFCASIGGLLPGVRSLFYSSEPVPDRILERFAEGVEILEPDGEVVWADQCSPSGTKARVNYGVEIREDKPFEVAGRSALIMDGKPRSLQSKGSGRVILGTPSSDEPGFELPDGALERVAGDLDLMFLSGCHYFTKQDAAGCRRSSERLARQLNKAKDRNPDLLRHLQYVVPKVAAHEAEMMACLKGSFDSFSLNAVELAGLLNRLGAAGMTEWRGEEHPPRETAERPEFVIDAAIALGEAMDLPRVQVHGRAGDVLVQQDLVDPDRQRLAFLRARQIATMKAANKGGEVRSPEHLWDLVPSVSSGGLAGLQAFADTMAQRFGLDPEARQKIVEDWYYTDSQGLTYMFVPNRDHHDLTGGTISLGDTFDSVALMMGLRTKRPRMPLHPSQLR